MRAPAVPGLRGEYRNFDVDVAHRDAVEQVILTRTFGDRTTRVIATFASTGIAIADARRRQAFRIAERAARRIAPIDRASGLDTDVRGAFLWITIAGACRVVAPVAPKRITVQGTRGSATGLVGAVYGIAILGA